MGPLLLEDAESEPKLRHREYTWVVHRQIGLLSSLQLFAGAAALLVARDVLANCEVGAYFIHTVAEYATAEDPMAYFSYEAADGRLRLLPTVTSEGAVHELFEVLKYPNPGFEMTFGGESCRPSYPRLPDGSLAVVTRLEDSWREVTRLELAECLEAELPPSGYARYDKRSRVLALGGLLAVERDPSAVPDRAALEEKLRREIFALGLRVEEFDAEERATIRPEDVESVSFGYTTVGSGPTPFSVVVAVLRLRHLDRLFGSDYLPAAKLATVANKLADFPVLFLRPPGAEPAYFGDGSWCSSYRLRPAEENPTLLEPLERFSVDAAYDFTNDGVPDLFVVNGVVVYALEPQLGLRVVDYGVGC